MRIRSAPIVVFLCIRIVIFRSRLRLPPRVVFDVDDTINFAAGIVEQPNQYICILSLFYSIMQSSWFYLIDIGGRAKKFSFSPKK